MYKNKIKAYIGITSYDWFDFIKERDIKKVNFWTKSTKETSLRPGELFFFLKKNSKNEKGERKLVGYGVFNKKETLTIGKAWENYKYGNGVESLKDLKDKLKKVIKHESQEIGCVILSEVCYFETPIYLSRLNIAFANQIQDGKLIYKDDIYKILNGIEEDLGYTEDIEFEEGQKSKRYIEAKKRNVKARELKLVEFNIKNGYIYCEVCKEDDICTIDVHHELIKVADMRSGHKTKLKDLRVVCASCHRKLHGHNITVDELKHRISNKYN